MKYWSQTNETLLLYSSHIGTRLNTPSSLHHYIHVDVEFDKDGPIKVKETSFNNNNLQTRVVQSSTLTLFKWDEFNDSNTYRGVETSGAIGVWSLNKPFGNAQGRRWYVIPPGQDAERSLGCVFKL